MRFEVPQFIEVEDKIIGPLTWKQFVYLAGGGGAAVIFFFTLPFFLFVLFSVPVAGLAGFLAFQQVNNRPFADFLESGVGYFSRNKLYLWRKTNQQVLAARQTAPDEVVAARPASHLPAPATDSITSLSRKLELEALTENQ